MRELHEANIYDTRYALYNRKHIVKLYDDLHKRNEFVNQFVNMYSKRNNSQSTRRKNQNMNINDIFDASLRLNSNDDENSNHENFNFRINDDDEENDENSKRKNQRKTNLATYDQHNSIDVTSKDEKKNEKDMNYDDIILFDNQNVDDQKV